MPNFYDDNADMRFYIERGVSWDPLVRLTEVDLRAPDAPATVQEAVSSYADVLDLVGTFAAEQVAPRWRELDTTHPKVVDGEVVQGAAVDEIFTELAALGLHGMCVPRELGGLNVPLLVYMLSIELFARADVSVAAHHGFHGGMAMAALMYSILEGTTEFDTATSSITQTRFRQAIDEIASGVAFGSMDITEPNAGSDMAQLRTRARQDAQGTWRVTGQKIFITSGHAKWHFVIARTEETASDDAFAGLAGLSMFLVPAYEDQPDGTRKRLSRIDGVEEKLGHNASATVSISFEDSEAMLVGERGEGFKYMLLLMNNARVGVAFESLGLIESAYRKALHYAQERPSMGKTIDQHEMIAEYLEEMRTDIEAIRALAVRASYAEELSQKLRLKLLFWPPASEAERAEVERERKRWSATARELTPLLKYYASEKAVHHARRSVQIHGGSGYIQETGVEKLLRDAMVFPIYEGTSQIQSLMAMKDTLLGAMRDPAGLVRDQASARWRSVGARDPLARRLAKQQVLRGQTVQYLLSRLALGKVKDLASHDPRAWRSQLTEVDPKRDFALAMLHAERLCQVLADVALAEELARLAADHPEKRDALERFLDRSEPRCRFWHDEITTTGARLLRSLAKPPAAQPAAAAAAK